MKLLLLAVVLLAVALSVEAQNRRPPANNRTLDIDTTQGQHVIIARLLSLAKRSISAIWFGFTTWGFPRFRVQYFHADDRVNKGAVAAFRFRFGIVDIKEYNDDGQDFNRSNVVRGSGIRLIGQGPKWSAIQCTAADANGKRVCSTSLGPSTGGCEGVSPCHMDVTLSMRFAPHFLQDGNATLDANKLKLDIDLNNINYIGGANTKLVVFAVAFLRTTYQPLHQTGAASPDDGNGLDETTVSDPTNPGAGGRFAWIRQIYDHVSARWTQVHSWPLRADDTDYTGASSGGSDPGDDDNDPTETQRVLMAFLIDTNGHSSHLTWDPDVAANELSSGTSGASVATPSLLLLVAMVASAAAAKYL